MLTPNTAGSPPPRETPASASGAAAVAAPSARRPYAAVFRALIALAAVVGVGIECVYGRVPVVLSFFTIWSNIGVAVVMGWGAVRAWTGRAPLPAVWTGGLLLCISVVGLVFHFVLANGSSEFNQAEEIAKLTGAKAVANQLLHTVTPIATVLDWLLLTLPGALHWRHAAQWLAAPAAYLAFALLRGALLSPDTPTRYTYPFIDAAAHGYAGVLTNALVLGAAFYALGLAIVALDRIRPATGRRGNAISS